MIRRASRYAFRAAVALLTLGILVVGTFLVIVAVPDLTGHAAVVPSPRPSARPSASPRSAMGLSPVGIEMPATAECNACHLTATGGVGTRPIPVMGHPLAGWRNCTACHAEASLVKTAPGHSSLHKDDCLICHRTRAEAGESAAPKPRPEHMGTSRPCTACHGVDKHAPLPESMAGRGDNCWICHNGPEYRYLFEQPSGGASAAPSSPSSPGPAGSAAPDEGARWELRPPSG